MDVSEQDRDVLIQKASADLIQDFESSLVPFLRKPGGQLRRRVRARETYRLVSSVLEPFQELPQLLDPHLPKFLPVLAGAYLESLRDRATTKTLSMRSELLLPLHNAICRLLYTFCKIRGEKVIVRFLNVETRYLELLLHAIEDAERYSDSQTSNIPWTWHERYVVLLWLSQLFFAPFDLSTISSGDIEEDDPPVIPGFKWPANLPGITLRVIPIAIKYLATPGKERDGAKALLVRIAMRRDMQEIGILDALVNWAIFSIRGRQDATPQSPYFYIGSISFLAGVLGSSTDTSIMDSHLSTIYSAVQDIANNSDPVSKCIRGSALARKTVIKVNRLVVTSLLRKPDLHMADSEIVESSIGFLLESLSDNDTPVRLGASKALSIITLKLEPDMASQVIEAVLEALNRNVLWKQTIYSSGKTRVRDLSAVDALEWHGLTLTLSHLLYRRSPPPEKLSDIIHSLIIGLSFEKRSPAGGSIGTNVRDAACFGIWALARRYTTAELLQVPISAVMVAGSYDPTSSILQVLATELVVSACLDSAGNIRRGASAALQELVGRHPDTIDQGIFVVQVVDYHAVALRSRSIHDVALRATKLSNQYGRALLDALLGWRGLGDSDQNARRVAATSFGALTTEMVRVVPSELGRKLQAACETLLLCLKGLQTRQVEERHGLLLSLAAIFDSFPAHIKEQGRGKMMDGIQIPSLLAAVSDIIRNCNETAYRKPELIAEAVSHVVVSATPLLLMYVGQSDDGWQATGLKPGPVISHEQQADHVAALVTFIDAKEADRPTSIETLLGALEDALNTWTDRNEPEVVSAAAQAGFCLLLFSKQKDRARIVQLWGDRVRGSSSQGKHGFGLFHALSQSYVFTVLGQSSTLGGDHVVDAITERWTRERNIETRVAMLQSLLGTPVLVSKAKMFLNMITQGLDDYTMTARGDVGSLVRFEAIMATRTLWEARENGTGENLSDAVGFLYPRVLRIAAEKLDRVRGAAQSALTVLLPSRMKEPFQALSFSSADYFYTLFSFCSQEHLQQISNSDDEALKENECLSMMLAGLVTSADTGNEDLILASRAALVRYCEKQYENLAKVCPVLIDNLKVHQEQDRVLVPTLEVVAYLFYAGIMPRYKGLNARQLSVLAQKAGFKTGNVRKLEACVRVYGGIASMQNLENQAGATGPSDLEQKQQEGILAAKKRLGALMLHPWPKIRTLAVDELWGLLASSDDDHAKMLLSVDWSRADKSLIKKTVGELGLA